MLIHLLVLVLSTAVIPGQQSGHQGRPDFSGTWDIDLDASKALTEKNGGEWRVAGAAMGAPRPAQPGAPAPRTVRLLEMITQTPTELILERGSSGEIVRRESYKLDGSESVNANRMTTTRTRTVWKGASLVTTGSMHMDLENARDANGNPITSIDRTFVTTRTLTPDGKMIVESRTTEKGQVRTTWSVLVRVKQ